MNMKDMCCMVLHRISHTVFLRSRKKFIRKMQVPVRIVFYCIYALIFLIGNYSMASVFINLLR